jgi:hypothetical protein
MSNFAKMVVADRFLLHLESYLGGHWLRLTCGRFSEGDLVLKLLGRDLGWSLLTGGCNSEVGVTSGLTVQRSG